MVFRVTKIVEIEAAHQLQNYNGPCANMHGHSYKIEVSLESKKLNEHGMVMDFKKLKNIIKRKVIDVYDHNILNNLMIESAMPTAENMCAEIFVVIEDDLKNGLKYKNHPEIKKVKIWETSSSFAEYEVD